MTQSSLEHHLANLIEHHLSVYRAKNIDAFAACYAEQVKVWNFSKPEEAWQGRAELHRRYKALFEQAGTLEPTILNRVVVPPYVIDEEYVTGIPTFPNGLRIGVVYKIEHDLICEMCFLR